MQSLEEPSSEKRDWRRAITSREDDPRAVALAALVFSVVNWPVQAFLLIGAIPPSHVETVTGALIFVGIVLLFAATVPFFVYRTLRIHPRAVWVNAVLWLALVGWALPALMALNSMYFILAPFLM